MKTLHDYLSINEDRWRLRDYDKASEIVKEHIKELEETLGNTIGIRNLKLSVSVKLGDIVIESDNLLPYLKDRIWATWFEDAHYVTRGGSITHDGKIWFDLLFSYEQALKGGRLNKRNFIPLRRISFDLNTKEWTIEEMDE